MDSDDGRPVFNGFDSSLTVKDGLPVGKCRVDLVQDGNARWPEG